MNRQRTISTIQQNPRVSVLIIGAGINGAGTFRDLALNGVDTLLIDRADFCSGASAASSHMAHGGIRYLENGEFGLVREAVNERNRMIKNAPHIVKPLPTTIPIFKFWSGLFNAPLKFLKLRDAPSERGALIIKLGLIMYDAFAGGSGVVPKHVVRGKVKTHDLFPKMHQEARYSATYYDGSIVSPERYTIEVILDGEAEGEHAQALNYVSFICMDGKTALLRDELTGETFKVEPDLIINAAGPWIDNVTHGMGKASKYIGGTKGSHLVLNNPDLLEAIGNNEIFFENKDGRIVLIFPLVDKVMIGTSDLPIEDPDSARCEEEEIAYFIDMVKRVFPTIQIEKDQIEYVFSGVRPLESSHSALTGQISRNHSIKVDDLSGTPVYSLVGGKWTSYREFAEQVTDKTLKALGRSRSAHTRDLAIGGGARYAEVAKDPNTDPALFEKYGSRCQMVMKFQPNGGTPLANIPSITKEEVLFLVSEEKVVHLEDLILRRTLLAYLGRLNRSIIEELAEICAEPLGWTDDVKHREVERATKRLIEVHRVRL